MAPDLHCQLRRRVDQIISEARKNAIEQDKQEVQNLHLEKLSWEEQIVKLIGVKQQIKQEAGKLEKKEYYRLDRYDHLISILYLSRLICLDQDDEHAIREGIRLNVKEQHIDLLLSKAKEYLGTFTFEDFLANRPHMAFYELDEKPDFISEEDYLNIRSWQTYKKIYCVKLEFYSFRENYRKAIKDEINIHNTLENEINQLQNILRNSSQWKAQQLMTELKKLKGLSGILLPQDPAVMHHEWSLFLQGNNFRQRLNPCFFETVQQDIQTGKISPLPILGLSLLMYSRWLRHIDQCKEVAFNQAESSFDNLFDKNFNKGLEKKSLALSRVKKKAMDRSFNDRHYEIFILQGMKEQRKVFNNLEYPHYFQLLDQKELLKNSFIEDCLRSPDHEGCQEALQKTILLDGYIQFFSEELSLFQHHPFIPTADQQSEIAVITGLLCHMAPPSELMNLFLDTRELIKKQVYHDHIPLIFICENLEDLFTEIFEKAVMNFKKLVEDLPMDKKWQFISGLLHEINYMETINGIKCHKKNIFFKQFKHLLKNELKMIHEMQSFHPAERKDNNKKKDTIKDKPFNFGYRPGPRPLRPIIIAMDLQMNFFDGNTTVDDFMEVVTCPDLTKVTKKLQLGLKTNIFARFITKAKPWFKNFTPARIEQSGIFISWKEGPITANGLYNSKIILAEDDNLMEKIFNAKYK